MEVTLRKANALSKALLEQAKKLPLTRAIEVSIYSEGLVADLVEAAGKAITTNVADARALTGAAYKLRAALGEANTKAGISALLTEKARLDVEEKLLVSVVEPASDYTYDQAAEAGIAEAKLTVLKDRAKAATSYGSATEELKVKVASADVLAPLKDDLLTIRRRKTAIADELLVLNTTTKVSVPSKVEALLNRFKLI